MSSGGGRIAVVAALAANLGIAVAKFVAWGATGSAALLSEAVHSVADSGNQVLLLIGGRRATRQPDVEHEFGYASIRYVYAFVVSIVLFLFGGAFALYEGWHRVTHPEPPGHPWWGLVVLLVAIVLETGSLRTAFHESRGERGSLTLPAYLRRARSPELSVVLLEDVGALTGLVFALAGLGLASATRDGRWDGLGSIAIGALLVAIAGWLSRRMASLLVGESVLPEQRAAMVAALAEEPHVLGVIHFRSLHLGPDEVLVAAKIAVDPGVAGADLAAAIDGAERRLRAVMPAARYVFLEPDLSR